MTTGKSACGWTCRGKKRYLIPLGLLLFVLLQSIPWNYLRYAAEVAGRFPEVDRAVVSVEGEGARTILDPTELAAYKEALEPTTILSGDSMEIREAVVREVGEVDALSQSEIREAVVREVGEVAFYIGREELVRVQLYLLDETAGEKWGRPTEAGLLIGQVDLVFRRLGSRVALDDRAGKGAEEWTFRSPTMRKTAGTGRPGF